MAFIDADGYVRINGRSKDIIIRGGENIPVMEVENLLYKHPAVSMVQSSATPMRGWASAPAPSSPCAPATASRWKK